LLVCLDDGTVITDIAFDEGPPVMVREDAEVNPGFVVGFPKIVLAGRHTPMYGYRDTINERLARYVVDALRRLGLKVRKQVVDEILEIASKILTKLTAAKTSDLLRATTALAIVAYVRRHGLPLTINEIAEALDIDRDKLFHLRYVTGNMVPVNPDEVMRSYVNRLTSELGFSHEQTRRVYELAASIRRKVTPNPLIAALVATYVVARLEGYNVSYGRLGELINRRLETSTSKINRVTKRLKVVITTKPPEIGQTVEPS
jgi:transcription initiation factor TFIIIB Brf1 subunit/transcription initiation factor TFIIB